MNTSSHYCSLFFLFGFVFTRLKPYKTTALLSASDGGDGTDQNERNTLISEPNHSKQLKNKQYSALKISNCKRIQAYGTFAVQRLLS